MGLSRDLKEIQELAKEEDILLCSRDDCEKRLCEWGRMMSSWAEVGKAFLKFKEWKKQRIRGDYKGK